MATTRNELKEQITCEIDKVCPDNVELDADSLSDIETAVDTVIEECEIDTDEEEEEEPLTTSEK